MLYPSVTLDEPLPIPFNYCDFFAESFEDGVCWYVHLDVEFFLRVILVGLVDTFGIIGNFLLAATILLSSRLRPKSINIFILNLSFSNVLQLAVVAPLFTTDSLTEFFELGYFGCKTKLFLQNLFFIVPMLTILVISIDRFLAIRYPFRDLKYTKIALSICALIWIIGVGVSSVEIPMMVMNFIPT